MRSNVPDYEDLAAELRSLAQKVADLRERVSEVEKVNARLEGAALTTSRALADISRHWDAVYEAMRREEETSDQ
jgi:predicted nuclease with TOPRIM domain